MLWQKEIPVMLVTKNFSFSKKVSEAFFFFFKFIKICNCVVKGWMDWYFWRCMKPVFHNHFFFLLKEVVDIQREVVKGNGKVKGDQMSFMFLKDENGLTDQTAEMRTEEMGIGEMKDVMYRGKITGRKLISNELLQLMVLQALKKLYVYMA